MRGKITGKAGKERYFVEGKEVSREEFDSAFPDHRIEPGDVCGAGHQPSAWPLCSEGAAVHPDQIPEATESAKNKGVPTSFTSDGCPIFTSRQHRKEYLRAYKMRDHDAGYSD